jgi:hypothetical protein
VRRHERGLGKIQLGGQRLHPARLTWPIEQTHGGGVARERSLGERVDVDQRQSHGGRLPRQR